MPRSIDAIASSPDLFPQAVRGDAILFRPMAREAYRRSIFLDHRIVPAGADAFELPIADLVAVRDRFPARRIGWIFHIAHCGSTLLARALDALDVSLVLREPVLLRHLGMIAAGRDAPPLADWTAQLDLATRLLGRRYRDEAATIIKANVPVNPIAHALMARDPGAPAVLLHFGLEDYLLAILRHPKLRGWVGKVTEEIAPGLARWTGPLDGLDTPERAAALWLGQMRIFADLLARFPGTASLDAERFLAEPAPMLAAAAAQLSMAAEPADIAAIVAGPLFRTAAKQPGFAFDNAAREVRKAETRARLAGEIERARAFVVERTKAAPLPHALARPLGGVERPLL